MPRQNVITEQQLIKLIKAELPEDVWPKNAKYARVQRGAHVHFLMVEVSATQPVLGQVSNTNKRLSIKLKKPVFLEDESVLTKKWLFFKEPALEQKSTSAAPVVDRGEKYRRQIKGVTVDIYDVLNAWGVTCSASQHAIKKLMMPGARGAKDRLKDLREADVSVLRAIELEEDRQKSVT